MPSDDHANLKANREQLSARLQEIAPPLAEVYRGALQLLAQAQMPGRAYFLAHAAREIANGLPEWITGAVSRKESRQLNRLTEAWQERFPHAPYREEKHEAVPPTADVPIPRNLFEQASEFFGTRHERAASRDAFQRLLQWLGPGNRYLLGDLSRLEKEWMDLRSWFEGTNKVPRSGGARPPDEREAIEHFERFEWWLGALLQGFFGGQRELEQILEDATPKRLPQLLPLLAPDQQRWLFFERLAEKADPSWLDPLEEAGFFGYPPGRVRSEEDPNVIVVPRWPASFYLATMALNPDAQEAVARITLKIVSDREIDNWLVQEDLAEVALRLPLSAAAKLSRRMLSWGAGPSGSDAVARKLGDLAVRLARGGHTKEALKLMRALVAFRAPAPSDPESLPGEPRPRIGNWSLKNIIEKTLPDFVEAVGLAGLDLICRTLKTALESGRRKADGAVDHSYVWLPHVESVGLHGSEQLREMLAAAVTGLASRLLETGTPLAAVIATLDHRPSGVSRRLTQYLLSQHAAEHPDILRAHLLRRQDFESFRREYRMLLAAGFSHLVSPERSTILEWIETGPDLMDVRRTLAFLKGREPAPEEIQHWRRRWQWQRLGPLTPHLSTAWLARQGELNQEFGPPGLASDPDFPQASFGAVGSPAPLLLAEIRLMSVPEIVARIKAWRPPSTQFPILPDDGAVLAEAVAEDPGRFADEASLFLDLGPTYTRAILDGLWRAARDRKLFDWSPVLDFASSVLGQDPVPVLGTGPWDDERAWEWSRAAVARLLKTGLGYNETVPRDLVRDRLWPLIKALGDDPVGTRVEAVGAAIEYAKWLAAQGEEALPRVPEVGAFLERQLADEQLRAPDVHAEFGSHLTLLAWHTPQWTLANLGHILPNVIELSEAAIRAYVRGPVPPQRVLGILREVYSRAVEQLVETPTVLPGVRTEAGYAQERLAEHLIILYGRGALDEIGATALLDSFLLRASPSLRRYAVFAVGRSLGANDEEDARVDVDLPAAVLERFARLWEKRMTLLATDPQVIHELPGFGSWFSSGRFDRVWALDQLEVVLGALRSTPHEPVLDQPGIVRHLASLADQEPVRAVRILRELAELADDGGTAYGWIDHAPTIVGAAIRSGEAEARRAVIGLLDRLGALGFRDVRQFVPASDDLDDPMTIPYFVWDQPMTVAQLRERLAFASEPERDRLLGMVLRQANDVDVWKFTTPQEVLARWDHIEKHLGRRRAFWGLLLRKWQEEGLLAN
jgi:hypothetical protein